MVASLTPWRLATSATLSLSASRRIRTICSSLYRFFFMCFSRSKKPLSPNYGGSKKPGQVTDALAQAKRRKDRAVETAKAANKLRRATIKALRGKGVNKKLLYMQASASLKGNLDSIHKDYAKDRERLYNGFQRRTWADWLKEQAGKGNGEALAALRARGAAQGLQGNTLASKGRAKPGNAPVIDNITKKGTVIYRVGKNAVR